MEKDLSQYGVAGAVAAILLTLFVLVFRTMFNRLLLEHDSFKEFMNETVNALRSLKEEVTANHRDLVYRLRSKKERIALENQLREGDGDDEEKR